MGCSLEGVSFWYPFVSKHPDDPRPRPALDDVSLTIESGQLVLLIGPSGCGKSALLEAIAGVIPHHTGGTFRGKIVAEGVDVVRQPKGTRGKVVLVQQDPEAQIITPFVTDEVVFGLENLRRSRPDMQRLLAWALDKARLGPKRGAFTYTLSGGQKQRLAIAACLVMDPQTLLMDAPITNLDPVGAQEVLHFIEEVRAADRGKTIVIAANKIDELLPLADRIIVMDHGRVVLDGSPDEILLQHQEQLTALGVFVPEIALIVAELQNEGLLDGGLPRTVEATAEALRPLQLPAPQVMDHVARRSSDAPVVEVENITFGYGKGPSVLHDLSLTIRGGESIAILGQNGSGKTTLMKNVVGLLTPTVGRILVCGKDTRTVPPLGVVSYVFQRPSHQLVTTSVEAELRLSLQPMSLTPPEEDARIGAALEQWGLLERRTASPFDLSMGEKRRLSVATMAIMRPAIMILDEPTTGLDRANTVRLMEIVHELVAGGMTLIQVTHDMEQVAAFTERALVVHEGHIVFDGTPRDLFSADDVLARAQLHAPPVVRLAQHLWPGQVPPVTVDAFLEGCRAPRISGR